MKDESRASLQAAVLRQTAKDPMWIGYWLARHQQTEDLDEQQLAKKLRITLENLVLLCLYRTPRSDHFREDLQVVCRRTGVTEKVLAQILRQEQTLARWAETGPAPAAGWHMAASDRPEEPKESEQADE